MVGITRVGEAKKRYDGIGFELEESP